MKITTKDFQILEGINTFEFSQGINVIVGPNASGKSSLFYALENCLTNPSGVSDCINYDAKSAEVTLEDNDESVTWIRTSDSSTYLNNKTHQKYVKASKLDSRDIADLGFCFNNKGKVANIHDEWSVLFPFGESDSDMFRLFEDIFNISCSFQIIDEMKKDEQYVKSNISNYQKEKQQLNEKITALTTIKEKVSKNKIDSYIQDLNEYSQQVSKLGQDYSTYLKASRLKNVVLPEVFDTTKLYECQHNYENLQKEYEHYITNKQKANIKIPDISLDLDIIDIQSIRNDYEQYCVTKSDISNNLVQVDKIATRIKEIQEEMEKFKFCPTCGHILEGNECLCMN